MFDSDACQKKLQEKSQKEEDQKESDYIRYRGKCREFVEELYVAITTTRSGFIDPQLPESSDGHVLS